MLDVERGPRAVRKAYWPVATAAMVALLAGCASTTPAPVASAPPPAPMAEAAPMTGSASSFDGIYRGEVGTGTTRGRGACNIADHRGRIDVKNGVATMRWNGILSGPVSPDGSLNIAGGNGASLVGTFAGATFSGKLQSSRCSYPVPSFTKG